MAATTAGPAGQRSLQFRAASSGGLTQTANGKQLRHGSATLARVPYDLGRAARLAGRVEPDGLRARGLGLPEDRVGHPARRHPAVHNPSRRAGLPGRRGAGRPLEPAQQHAGGQRRRRALHIGHRGPARGRRPRALAHLPAGCGDLSLRRRAGARLSGGHPAAGRAGAARPGNGLGQLSQAAGRILAPVLGGVLLVTIGIQAIVAIDCATYGVAITTLLLVRVPTAPPSEAGEEGRGTVWHEAAYGWRYLVARPGLLALPIMFGVSNFLIGIVEVLVTPLVLAIASPPVLGAVLSVGGLGMVVGSVVMSVWGGPRRLAAGTIGFLAGEGLCILLGGLRPSVLLLGAAAFGFFFCLPIANGCTQSLLQRKVDAVVLGRVFAVDGVMAGFAMPLGYLIAGPLADRVFEPLLVQGGPLAGSVGAVLGVGPGRGIGLLFVLAGLLCILTAAAAWSYPRLRLIERELPDVAEPRERVAAAAPTGASGPAGAGDVAAGDGAASGWASLAPADGARDRGWVRSPLVRLLVGLVGVGAGATLAQVLVRAALRGGLGVPQNGAADQVGTAAATALAAVLLFWLFVRRLERRRVTELAGPGAAAEAGAGVLVGAVLMAATVGGGHRPSLSRRPAGGRPPAAGEPAGSAGRRASGRWCAGRRAGRPDPGRPWPGHPRRAGRSGGPRTAGC